MSAMHMRFVVFSVVLAGFALPVCAQRVGVTGQSGGLEGYMGPAYSSYAAVGRFGVLSTAQYGTVTTPQFGAPSYARLGPSQSASGHPNPAGNYAGHSLDIRDHHDRFDHDRDDRNHAPYLPLFGVVTLYGTGYAGYSNPGFYVDLANPAARSPQAGAAAEYDTHPIQQTSRRGDFGQAIHAGVHYPTADRHAPAAPPSTFRPTYQRQRPEPDLGAEAAVTLIFKDGSPCEQIRNYILTRKTLYVQENVLREIPVDQLDMAATEKINEEDGVDFHLPGISRRIRPQVTR